MSGYAEGGWLRGPGVPVSLDDRECVVRPGSPCARLDPVHRAYHAIGCADTDEDGNLRHFYSGGQP